MKQKAFKFIMSGAAIAATALSLTATTYAFVIIGNNVYVQDFDFNIEGYDGLQVSLDGENYSQDITSDMIKEKIAGSVEAFNNTDFRGVTIKQANGKALYNTDGTLYFEKDVVKYNNDTYKYYHEFADATYTYTADSSPDYICFDLYFRTVSSGSSTGKSLAWGENTAITSFSQELELETSFDTWSKADGDTYYTATHHKAGDKVTQNVANAMRLATVNTNLDDPLTVFEVTDANDLGSAAITDSTNPKNDPYQHLMINYYNAYFPLYPFECTQDTRKWLEKDVDYVALKYDEDGNPVYTTVYVYDENGDPVYVQATDSNGVLLYETTTDEYGNTVNVVLKDKNGAIQYDEDGNVMYVPIYAQKTDENGNLVYDEYGTPVYEQETTQGPQATYIAQHDVEHLLTGVYGAEDGEAFDTESAYGTGTGDSWNGKSLGEFDSDGELKITIYLWLEGWDADYLVGTTAEASRIGMNLEFIMKSGS